MRDTTVGIDIGTTSVKAVVVDAAGTVIDRVRVPHPVRVPAADRLEHDAGRAWRRGPRRALAKLDTSEATAVAVSTMVPSMTAVDRRGRPLTAGLLYGDARGRDGTVERRRDSDAGEVLGFIRWTAAQAPDAAGYWPASAVANYALGAAPVLDMGTAYTTSPLFNRGEWDAEVCAELGIDVAQLPRLGMTGAPIGTVTGTSMVLAGGCVDGMCEQLVAGADEPGDVLVICGTTLITWLVTAEPVTAPGLWSVAHLAPGRFVVGGPSNAGGLFLNWATALLGDSSEDVNPASIPLWVPYPRGERVPLQDPNRRGQLVDLDLTHGPAAAHPARCQDDPMTMRRRP